MYENPNEFERALLLFCNRVDIICAMEMSRKITAQNAYKEIKEELKELKRAKKHYGKDL